MFLKSFSQLFFCNGHCLTTALFVRIIIYYEFDKKHNHRWKSCRDNHFRLWTSDYYWDVVDRPSCRAASGSDILVGGGAPTAAEDAEGGAGGRCIDGVGAHADPRCDARRWAGSYDHTGAGTFDGGWRKDSGWNAVQGSPGTAGVAIVSSELLIVFEIIVL